MSSRYSDWARSLEGGLKVGRSPLMPWVLMPMAVSGRPTLTGANADTDGMAHRAKSELTTFIILDILCLLCIDANNPIRVQFRRLL